jgi:hypothetical protein
VRPSARTHEARFRHENNGEPYFTVLPVVGWSGDGCALVADEKTGRLRDADTWSNFAGLVPVDPVPLNAIPGQGWLVECETGTGDTETAPVLAWAFDSAGNCTPLVADSDGYTEDATVRTGFTRIYHPDQP